MKLVFDRPLSETVKGKNLRGAIAGENRNFVGFHHHTINGSLLYTYPLVQYKIIPGSAYLVGLREGALKVGRLNILGKTLNFGQSGRYKVIEQERHFSVSTLGISSIKRYKFLSAWLALNEKNYQTYQRVGSKTKRREILERIIIGNIISMSKGLGYTVTEPISAKILRLKEVNTSLKGNPMLGFLGEFEINFEIPNYLGIGKSVSRGFGTIKRISV